jgi:putative PEP-CTERM system TPR-repeat lipoprotein
MRILPVFLLALLTACQPKAPAELLQEAEAAIAAGDYRTARIHLKNIIQQDASNVAALVRLADVSLAAGEAETAAIQYRRAAKFGASEDRIRIGLLESQLQLGRYQDVLDQADPAATATPGEQATTLRLRGRAYAALGLFADAEAELKNSIELQPGVPDAHANLAEVYLRMRREDEANMEIMRALEIDSEYPQALLLRGQLELSEDDFAPAEATFQYAARVAEQRNAASVRFTALSALAEMQLSQERLEDAAATTAELSEIAPDHPFPRYLSARVAAQRGDLVEAKTLLQDALRIQENLRPAQRLLGTIYATEGNYNLAEMYLRLVVNADPNDFFARRMLANVRLGQDRPDEALALLEKAPETDEPESQRGLLALAGQASLQSGDKEKAMAYFRAGAKAYPADWRFQLGQALTLLAEGQYDKAIELLQNLDDEAVPYRKSALLVFAYLQEGRSRDALSLGTRLVQDNPDQAWPHNLLGTVHLVIGNPDEAYEDIVRALELEPGNTAALANLARAEAMRGNPEAVADALQRVIKQAPDNSWARVALARQEVSRGDREQALKLLRPVQENSVDARLLVGSIEGIAGNTVVAREIGQGIVTADPSNARGYNLLGLTYLADKSYQSAIRNFETAARLAPKSSTAQLNLARTYLGMHDQEAARAAIANARILDPNSTQLRFLEIVLFTRDGDYVRAERLLETPERTGLDPVRRLALLGELRAAQDRHAEAAEAYQAAYMREPSQRLAISALRAGAAAGQTDPTTTLHDWIKQKPDDVLALNTLGQWYLDRGELEAARQHFERALESDQSQVLALNNLAWIYDETGDDRALQTAEQAYRLQPDSAAIADTLGWIHLRSGNLESALELLRKAAEAVPENPEIQYHLAVAYVELGDLASAKEILANLVGTDQQFPSRQAAEQTLAGL